MKIISWNVNGLRAIHRKGNWDWLIEYSPDVFCLQETKSRTEQLPPEVADPLGYHGYLTWPTEKKGYSGVAIYSKKKPDIVKDVFEADILNGEGRLLEAHFGDVVVLNGYFPNGGGGPERLKYKLAFYDAFLLYIEELRASGKSIVFCGDVNTAHEAVDLARPKANEKSTGFLPIEREWIDAVIRSGYSDVWRVKNPDIKDVYTYWDMKTRARVRNVGWRIDYFFASTDLMPKIKDMKVLVDVLGSDHCPIELDIKI